MVAAVVKSDCPELDRRPLSGIRRLPSSSTAGEYT
jgi:hypothetical protein